MQTLMYAATAAPTIIADRVRTVKNMVLSPMQTPFCTYHKHSSRARGRIMDTMPDETPAADVADVVDEPAAALHESAEEAHETAENLHESAESLAEMPGELHEEARAHEEHAETRELAANAIDDVCHRVDAIEQHLHIGQYAEQGAGEATGDIENVGEGAVDVVAEPATEVEEEAEVHTRRRRVFGKARRR